MDMINHLLAHHLPANDAILSNLAYIQTVLSERAVARCESEEGLGGPVMHRWNLRLASLISPSVLPPLRTAGFQLLHLTFAASTTSLLSQAKSTLAPALNTILGSTKSDPSLFVAAMEVVRLVLAKSTWHAEWAREVAGAAVVQRTVQGLVGAANGEVQEIKLPAIEAIVSLIPLFPTPLRPLSPALHALSISFICDPAASRDSIDAGANLFVSLYLLAPKGREGLKEAWRKGVEALIGSMDSLVAVVTSDIFAEDPLTNHTLSPLALPPLSDNSPVTALARIEALSQALCLTLRTPTSERAGAVEVPVGALVELGVRLVGMSVDMPVKERVDPATLTLSISLLSRLQAVGCQIFAQLGLCIGPQLVPHASEVLGTISRTLSTYPLRSPMRPTLSTTYSLLLSSLGASVDPEEGKKSLARVWRCVLEDIGSVAIEPVAAAPSEDKGRKNKKQKTYDPSESMDFAGRRVHLDEMDLAIAERGLAALERLLFAPHSHFLPPKLQLATSRLLLFLSLDPAFFSSHASSSSTSSTFFPATSARRGVDIAKQSHEFRRGVLRCLRASLEAAGGGPDGLVDRAAEVWRKGCMDGDEEIKSLSVRALSSLSSLIHPSLPPSQINTTFARQRLERQGGPVGDDQCIVEGATEFRAKEDEAREAEAMEVDVDVEVREKVEVVVEQPSVMPSFSSSKGFGAMSGGGAVNGFGGFGLKKVEVTKVVEETRVEVEVEEEEEEEEKEEVVAPSFVAVPAPAVATGMREAAASDDDGSDDEAMPTIHMDSDEE